MRFCVAFRVFLSLSAFSVGSYAAQDRPCPTLVLSGFEPDEKGHLVFRDPLAPLISNYTSYTRQQLFRALFLSRQEGWLSRKEALTSADLKATAHADSPSVYLHTNGLDLGKSSVEGQPDGFQPAIDRRLTSFYALQLFLKDDYDSFVQAQKTKAPETMPLLPLERFSYWRKFFIDLLAVDAKSAKQAFADPALPLASWCDSEKFRVLLVTMAGHGLEKSMDSSAAWMAALEPRSKRVPLAIFNRRYDLEQDVGFVAPDAMLAQVAGMDAFTIQIYIASLVMEVASAQAAVDPNGARLFHAEVEKTYAIGARNMERVAAGESVAAVRRDSARERVREYGMALNNDEDYLLAKLVLCSQALSTEKARATVAAFYDLPSSVQAILRKEMMVSGIDDGWAILLEDSHHMIHNLEKVATWTRELNPGASARFSGFTQIARIYQQLRTEALRDRRGSGMLHVNINPIANAVLAVSTAQPAKLVELKNVLFDFRVAGNEGSVNVVSNIQPMSRTASKTSLSEILNGSQASHVVIVGMGGGGDVMQGAALSAMIEKTGKGILGFVSVRGKKPGRAVTGSGKSPHDGVYEIAADTQMSGRYFEPILAREGRRVFSVMYDSAQSSAVLSSQIDSAIHALGQGVVEPNAKVLVLAIDAGGGVLIDSTNPELADPAGVGTQQNADVLLAVHQLASDPKRYDALVGVVAAGMENPLHFASTGAPAGASVVFPTAEEKQEVLEAYKRWQLSPETPATQGLFSRTGLAWQLALRGSVGSSLVPLPQSYVVQGTNPWDPFPYLYPDAAAVLFYSAGDLLNQLPGTVRWAGRSRAVAPEGAIVLPDLSGVPVSKSLASFPGELVSIIGSGTLEDFAKCVFLARQLKLQGKRIGMIAFVGPTGKIGQPIESDSKISNWYFDDGTRVMTIEPDEDPRTFDTRMQRALQWSYLRQNAAGELENGEAEDSLVLVDTNWQVFGQDAESKYSIPRTLSRFLASKAWIYQSQLLLLEVPGHLPPPSDVLRQIDSGLLKVLNFNRTEVAAFGTAVTQVGADPARSRIGSVLMGPLLNHMHHRGDFPIDTRVFGAMVPARDHREVPAGVKVDAVLPSEITEALAQDYSIPEFGLVRGTLSRLPGARGDSYGVRFVIVTVIDGKRTVFRGRVLKVDGCTIEYITESGEIRVTNTNYWEDRRGATVIALRNY